ncbi:MAG: Do family serine endopeptidase [Imperialibacter sp.]|uniref:Do family serine endopeptidase n=1 Tax=Imperialibacter sp. TaxID=2038411 RepID=UPI0032EE8F90
MNKRQIYVAMLFSSLLSAMIAIGGYQLLNNQNDGFSSFEDRQNVRFSNFLDTTSVVVPEGLNFVYAAKAATPGVVHIRSKYTSTPTASNNQFDQYFQDFFGNRGQRPPSGASGSGVIIADNGYIVTNNHVVENASEVEVLMNDNRTFDAKVVGTDPTTDLALLKIDGKNLPFVKFGSSEHINVGEWVLAIGNPFEFRSTVTAGIVSATGRNINILRDPSNRNLQIESFIQTDAAVNPGNSGGALVNLRGELVGINTAIATHTGSYSGYSFAVPTTLVKKVMDDLKEFGVVQRALLGVNIVDVNSALAEARGLNVLKGISIENVNPNSGAADAGLEKGDVIIAIDGKTVDNVAKLQEKIAVKRPGDKVEVGYIRDGKENSVMVTLKSTSDSIEVVEARSSFSIEGSNFTDVSREEMQTLKIDGGAKATEVNDGKWKEAGVRAGFIITNIDKTTIRNIQDLARVMANKRGGTLIEGVYPDGTEAFYGIGW